MKKVLYFFAVAIMIFISTCMEEGCKKAKNETSPNTFGEYDSLGDFRVIAKTSIHYNVGTDESDINIAKVVSGKDTLYIASSKVASVFMQKK